MLLPGRYVDQPGVAEVAARRISRPLLHQINEDLAMAGLPGFLPWSASKIGAFGLPSRYDDEFEHRLELILDVRRRGVSVVPVSHDMAHVFEIADRIHILGSVGGSW